MEIYQIVLIIVGALALLFLAATLGAATYLYRFAIVRRKPVASDDGQLPFEQMMRKSKKEYYLPRVKAGIAWMQAHRAEAEEVCINSHDGLRLYGELFAHPSPQGLVILSHGFHSIAEADFGPVMDFYQQQNFSALLIDHRGHNRSEGKHVCFGVKERYDLRAWMRFAAERCPGVPIFLSGISMGCASALYAAQLPDLPSSFCGVIADCGYDDPYEQVRWFVKNVFHMPTFMLPAANLYCRVFAGFSMKDCSVTAHPDDIHVPVLYLHGTEDHVVPIDNAYRICRALGERARLTVTENALHGCSFLEDPEKWKTEVASFITYCKSLLTPSETTAAS